MFLGGCRIVERECRSLGRLKDVELWGGKSLKRPLVVRSEDMERKTWKSTQDCRSVVMERKTWKTSQDCRSVVMERKTWKTFRIVEV